MFPSIGNSVWVMMCFVPDEFFPTCVLRLITLACSPVFADKLCLTINRTDSSRKNLKRRQYALKFNILFLPPFSSWCTQEDSETPPKKRKHSRFCKHPRTYILETSWHNILTEGTLFLLNSPPSQPLGMDINWIASRINTDKTSSKIVTISVDFVTIFELVRDTEYQVVHQSDFFTLGCGVKVFSYNWVVCHACLAFDCFVPDFNNLRLIYSKNKTKSCQRLLRCGRSMIACLCRIYRHFTMPSTYFALLLVW